jgi:hypothetical protein
MILIPFGFTQTGVTGSVPVNTVAPLVFVVDAETRQVGYTAGTWTGATTVEFAWYMNNVLQSETGSTFIATYDQDVKVVETATNDFGIATQDSNIVNIPSPPQFDAASFNYTLTGQMADTAISNETDAASFNYTVTGRNEDSISETVPTQDTASVYWEVFGSYV